MRQIKFSCFFKNFIIKWQFFLILLVKFGLLNLLIVGSLEQEETMLPHKDHITGKYA